MTLQMTKDQIIKLIKTYYKKYQNMDVDVKFNTFTNCSLDFNKERSIKINIIVEEIKDTYKFKNELDIEDIKNILKTLLLEEMNLDEMDINYNVNELEQFEGLRINIKSKQNIKNLKYYEGILIVVDMINGFVKEGALHDKKIIDVVPRQIELIKDAKQRNDLVVFIRDVHTERSVEHKRFNGALHCIKGSGEENLIDELKPYQKDSISFEKNSTSFMFAKGFIQMLEQLKNLKRVDVIGCCTDICIANGVIPMMNYFDENNRDIIVNVHEDAIETYDAPFHDRNKYKEAALLLMNQQGAKIKSKKIR